MAQRSDQDSVKGLEKVPHVAPSPIHPQWVTVIIAIILPSRRQHVHAPKLMNDRQIRGPKLKSNTTAGILHSGTGESATGAEDVLTLS
jgi:hypothetical protein